MPQQKRVDSIQHVWGVQQSKLECELVFPLRCPQEACYETDEEQSGSEPDALNTEDRPPELRKHAGIAGTAGIAGIAGIANHTHK